MKTEAFEPIEDERDPRVVAFLSVWHEKERADCARRYPSLDYDTDQCKWAENRRLYICLNDGEHGVLMLEKSTGEVYGIKAYGRINRKQYAGHIEGLLRRFREERERKPTPKPKRQRQ